MGDEFKRVMILADYGSVDLAQRVYNELAKRKIHDGLEDFNKDALYINRFAAGEIDVDTLRNVRGRDVFFIKSYSVCPKKWDPEEKESPDMESLIAQPNEAYMELFLINDALRRAEARSITDVFPFMPYLRQDRRPKREGRKTRSPVSAKLFATLTEASGANRVINFDPHFKQIEGFYDIPYEGLDSFVIFAEYIEKNLANDMERIVFVAPDQGSAERAKDYSRYFKRPFVIIDKTRLKPGVSSAGDIIGDMSLLKGALCILIDDMIDGGGTLVNAGIALKANRAAKVIAECTHPLLTGNAKKKLLAEDITLVTTESILIPNKGQYPNIVQLDIDYPIAQAIRCVTNGESISDHLFNYKKYREVRAANL